MSHSAGSGVGLDLGRRTAGMITTSARVCVAAASIDCVAYVAEWICDMFSNQTTCENITPKIYAIATVAVGIKLASYFRTQTAASMNTRIVSRVPITVQAG